MTLVIPAIVAAAAAIFACAAFYLFAGALAGRARGRKRRAAEERVRAEIMAAVVDFAAGSNDTAGLQTYAARHRAELQEYLLLHFIAVRGEVRDRLAGLALDLGLVKDWCAQARSRRLAVRRAALSRLALLAVHEPARRQSAETLLRALEDNDREIRLEAARSVAHSGNADNLSEIFRLAISESPLVRAILARELAPRALELCESAVPEALHSTDPHRVAGALEMIAAWERAVPLPDLAPLLSHFDAGVRMAALRVVPLAWPSEPLRRDVILLLADPVEEVSAAAAFAVARLKLDAALMPLAQRLRQGRVISARATAAGLAALAPLGLEVLTRVSQEAEGIVASAAEEALERARMSAVVGA